MARDSFLCERRRSYTVREIDLGEGEYNAGNRLRPNRMRSESKTARQVLPMRAQ